MLSKHSWKAKLKKSRPIKLGYTINSDYMIITESGIWRNLLVLNNNSRVWLAVVIWRGAQITKVDEFF